MPWRFGLESRQSDFLPQRLCMLHVFGFRQRDRREIALQSRVHKQRRILCVAALDRPAGDAAQVDRLCELAVGVLTNSVRYGARHRILQRLVDALRETCNLTALCGSEIVYLDRVETDWPLRMHLSPGSRVPAHCTATGKLLLSLLPERQMNDLIRAASLRRYTERTITDPDQLIAALARIREDGVGVDDEEFAAGMVAGGTQRNHAFVSERVDWGTLPEPEQFLLADAQTSGGLLLAVAPAAVDELVEALTRHGTLAAAVVGHVTDDTPGTIAVV